MGYPVFQNCFFRTYSEVSSRIFSQVVFFLYVFWRWPEVGLHRASCTVAFRVLNRAGTLVQPAVLIVFRRAELRPTQRCLDDMIQAGGRGGGR